MFLWNKVVFACFCGSAREGRSYTYVPFVVKIDTPSLRVTSLSMKQGTIEGNIFREIVVGKYLLTSYNITRISIDVPVWILAIGKDF